MDWQTRFRDAIEVMSRLERMEQIRRWYPWATALGWIWLAMLFWWLFGN